MTQPVTTFGLGAMLAKEDTYGVAPQNSTNHLYAQGGRWIPLVTSDPISITTMQETIFPAGHSGLRSRNNRPPVKGRRWSAGDANFDFTMDLFGAFAYGALGSASVNMVPSTQFELVPETAIVGGSAQNIIPTDQPSDGGAILRIYLDGSSTPIGKVEVKGTNANGQSASEIIGFNQSGSLYTRTSFSAISSVDVESDSDTNITIQGIQYWDYTITQHATSNPTWSVEKHGDPMSGAASRSFMYTGMVVQNFGIQIPAEARDGIITGNITMEGNPSTNTCIATTLPSVSAIQVVPAWSAKVSRNGEDYFRVLNFDLTIDTANRNWRTAAGVQNPQGAFFGSQAVEGTIEILAQDELEFNQWLDAESSNFTLLIDTPTKLTSTVNQQITASLTRTYLEQPSIGESDEAVTASFGFKTVHSDAHEIISIGMKSQVPPSAYGL